MSDMQETWKIISFLFFGGAAGFIGSFFNVKREISFRLSKPLQNFEIRLIKLETKIDAIKEYLEDNKK